MPRGVRQATEVPTGFNAGTLPAVGKALSRSCYCSLRGVQPGADRYAFTSNFLSRPPEQRTAPGFREGGSNLGCETE